MLAITESKIWDPTMKENGSPTSKMISKNWVMKRKRRKLRGGPGSSSTKQEDHPGSESPKNMSSAKLPLTNSITSDPSPRKEKGDDGHYYECMICDLGGTLLCCERCPQTYHIQCLNPPLKRIPKKKWLCPNCRQESDTDEPKSDHDTFEKRARTKIVNATSKNATGTSETEKVSQIFGRSILGKKRAPAKIKSPISRRVQSVEKELNSSLLNESCSAKPSHIPDGDCEEGNLLCLPNDNEKKPDLSSTDIFVEKKASPSMEVLPSSKISSLKSSLDISNLEPSEAANEKNPDTSISNVASEEKSVPRLGSTSKKSKKRKRKLSSNAIKKRSRTDKGNSVVTTCKKQRSQGKSKSSGPSKLHRIRKKVDCRSFTSLSEEDVENESSDVRRRVEKLPKKGTHSLRELNGADHMTNKTVAHGNNGIAELQQVDRVLGCRVQGHITNVHSDTLPNSENRNTQSEENSFRDKDKDGTATEALCEENQSTEKCIPDDIKEDNLHIYKKDSTNEFSKGSAANSVEVDTTVTVAGDQDKDSVPMDESGRKIEKIEIKDTEDKSLKSSDICEFPSFCEKLKHATTDTQVAVEFEFLIKWVGKSHIHNNWISESQLKFLAKRKLENYKAKYGTAIINICEERWKQPQRVIAVRTSKDGTTEALVKWNSLPYDECTWERLDEPVIERSSHLVDLYHQFEQKTMERDDLSREKIFFQKSGIITLTEQPKELRGGSLFPHQLEALNWLRKCWLKSKNVILADEMGLGKTVSASAFLSSLYHEFKAKLPCIVLVPLSTMPNWLSEFSLWAPDLNVVEYHGCAKARTMIRQYEWHASTKTASYKFNVLLTTYEMVIADSSQLRGIPWEVLIVDEGHRLKNSSSKLFSLLNTYSFQHRVLLTGTPLQNNIGEMYNLLNFLQPTSFPSLALFEEKFNDLTTAERVDELKKLVAPHMLRRLKKDAMQNIPPKTERMVPVELSSIQAEYYRAMLTKNYQILRNIGKGVAQQSMLNIVMQLRKVCNHPYLIPGTEPEVGSVEFLHEMRIKASAKLTLLHSMLKELHKEGHRVLIFSQMTKLLDILEDYLNVEFGPKTFERVDGSVSVSDRQAAISRFNQDKNRFVFLLSTRACGLGINLATADTVIIYDSDFNPHADIQAMNRAHRIGQSKRLLVYRLVVRASVEERILQLAKKKLMLDQLFVNKSGSQKEVEDILRWGTEELFKESSGKDIGENEEKKDDAITELEHKHRRRVGGLGDVYTDKCTDGSNKIVWDETAIQKLLDRSDESVSSDIAEGEAEYDMLGSVKSLEWNDEQQEEQGVGESLPVVADDCAENPESKEGSAEENEWDRLLRLRWEKYQNEEEAVLGRGKRQRKNVSYREAFAPRPTETMSEGGNDEEREPELEPKKEYTPAGRALKAKFTMLRARQKEWLAMRNSTQGTYITKGLPSTNAQGRYQGAKPFHLVREKDPMTLIDENKFRQPLDVGKSKAVSALKMGKMPKHRSHLDQSVRPLDLGHPSSHHCQGTSYGNSATNNLLPVLGLCAPNASQQDPVQRKLARSNGKQQSRLAVVPEFPYSQAPPSRTCNAMKIKGQETNSDKGILSDTSHEAFQQRLKDKIVESRLPFNLNRHQSVLQEKKNEHSEHPGVKFSEFQEKMLPPNLSPNEKLNLGYTCPPDKNVPISHSDFLPSLSLGIGFRTANDTMPGLPTMPLLPNFKSPQEDAARYNNQQQGKEMPPMLGLNQMQPAFLSFPENHRKVLENIMMRTGSGSSSFFKRKAKVENWSEDELDCLWIGVRRHGLGNWEGMLRDPRLSFSKYKTSEDLSLRWDEEQLKIMDGSGLTLPNSNKRPKSSKSPLFPSVSDGMMQRALHGSRFGVPLNLQPTHLTDMKLGFGDLPPNFPHTGQSDYNQHYAHIPTLNTDRIRTEFSGDAFAKVSDRSGTSSNRPTEKSYLPNSFGTNYPGSLGMNYSGKFDLQQQEDVQGYGKYRKCSIPDLLDRSNNFSLDPHYTMKSGEAVNLELLSGLNRGITISRSKGKEVVAECALSENKLPHWLRQAVSAPVKSPDPDLPPTVTAIAQSVRLLYGEEKPIIPPFVVPSPRPSQPIDPRLDLKKKKMRKYHVQGENTSSPFIPMPPPFHMSSQSMARIESDLNVPTVELNMMNLASSSVNINPQKKPNSGLSPSPEVLQFVASSFLQTKLPLTNAVEEESITNTNTPYENLEDNQILPLDIPAQPPVEKTEQIIESGDSSKTHSDPPRTEKPDLDEVSSEGTVSDHPVIDHES